MDFFAISKFFWMFAAPSHLLVWLAAAGALLSARPIGRFLVAVWPQPSPSCSWSSFRWGIGRWRRWKTNIPVWPLGRKDMSMACWNWAADSTSAILHARGIPGGEAGDSRPVTAFELARRIIPGARIVFSGGVGDPALGGSPRTTVARYIFGQFPAAGEPRALRESRPGHLGEFCLFPGPGETEAGRNLAVGDIRISYASRHGGGLAGLG